MGATFAQIASAGPLLLAVGVALIAGLVSFLSPCVLPLVPGYLSYVTGLAGADLDAALGDRDGPPGAGPGGAGPGGAGPGGAGVAVAVAPVAVARGRGGRRRVLAGTLLFVAGFTAVFVPTVVLVTRLARVLWEYQTALEIGVGLLIIGLGLAFLGWIPGLQREFRIHRLPAAGLLGAPVLGAVFALSWLPCSTPTLGAVVGLAAVGGQTDRAVILAVAYCLGLGLPFVAFGVAFQRLLGVFRAVRRNSRWVTRLGGALLVLVGLALVTGAWNAFLIWLQVSVGVVEIGL